MRYHNHTNIYFSHVVNLFHLKLQIVSREIGRFSQGFGITILQPTAVRGAVDTISP